MAFVTDIQFTREVEENGKLPFLDCLVSRDNTKLPAILSHRRSTTVSLETYPFISMQYDRQLIRRELTSTLTVFFQRTITTKNSSNVTLTDLLLLLKLTTTQLLRPQQLYHTQRACLRTSRTSYNPSTSASLTNLLPHYGSYWLTSKTKTNPGTDREQYIRSIAPTTTPPTSVRLSET